MSSTVVARVDIGAFVKVAEPPYNAYGVGKLSRRQGKSAVVTFFDMPDDPNPPEAVVPLSAVVGVDLPPQTRVYRLEEETRRWQVGRVLDGEGSVVLVQFPNGTIINVPREDLQTRWRRPISDPVRFLSREVTETPLFADARGGFLREVTKQRSSCLGMGAILASRIQLTDYQFNVAQRVLQDPVQRYLLADEVGLGKTIEAGILIRQYASDFRLTARVLVIVPPVLVNQWKRELAELFALGDLLDDFIHVVGSHDLQSIRAHMVSAGMLVVDEAHHLSRGDTPESDALYRLLQEYASRVPRLLLLSATPVLSDTAGFLRVLHLLDPVVFPLDDLGGLERRVQSRQLVAEVVAGLVPENILVLESDLDRLEGAFSDDECLLQLTSRLRPIVQALPNENDEVLLEALSALRAHLTETYKLHRRLLRNRRKSVPWATPRRSGLAVKSYRCPTTAERRDALEALRLHLINRDGIARHADVLWAAAVHPNGTERLSDTLRSRNECEAETLAQACQVDLLARKGRQDGARIETAVQAVQELLKDPLTQVVVFCDRPVDADDVCQALVGSLPGTVQRHQSDDTNDDQADEAWREFITNPNRCRVLVCDAQAEEGLNLHGGRKVAVHFDLPTSPNRIEQRLGRLDRFGTGDAVKSIAIVCEDDLDEMAWMSCLRDGLQLFDTSIASLQYLVEEGIRPIPDQWLALGCAAIDGLTARLAGPTGWVARERKRIDQQDALDALGEPPSDAYEQLEKVDGEWSEWRQAFDAFAINILQFERRRERWDGPLPEGEQVFRLGFSKDNARQTLMPLGSFISDFLGTIDVGAPRGNSRNPLTYPYSFRRNTALSKEGRALGLRPLRYGDALVESFLAFCDADDRGRVFAMWRHVPGYQAHDASGTDLFFRFDYLVEAAIEATEEVVGKGHSGRALVSRALRRRAETYFLPQFVTVWVSAGGTVSTDAPLVALGRYRSNGEGEGRRDYNLNANRWQVLHMQADVPWTRAWSSHCRDAHARARAFVVAVESVTAGIERGARALRKHHAIRMAQLDARVKRTEGTARIAEAAEREAEQSAFGQLLAAIESPAFKLDSVGAIFVSPNTPFAR